MAFKVLKLKIIKPVNMDWNELGQALRDTRYRVYRLANLAVSEAYVQFHLWRAGKTDAIPKATAGQLNRRLREMLLEENEKNTLQQLDAFSKTGALPDTVAGALFQYKIRALTSPQKWKQVIRGQSSLPTFRNNMAIPIRCDRRNKQGKPIQKRLERTERGVELELMIRNKPYPRILLGTLGIGESAETIIERLLENPSQADQGYKQRYFEVKEDQNKQWWLCVYYTFPAPAPLKLDPSKIVGVDIGYTCPVYAAISHGHARLGYKAFASLADRVKKLKWRTMQRRKQIQWGGNVATSADSARAGHGRKRKLLPTAILQERVNHAYTTLNHQMSAAVIKFALDNGCGTIQLENTKESLCEELRGTFLGIMWRYFQLQEFIKYKAKEKGIQVQMVNPQYTSRRCSKCGNINEEFTRKARDRNAVGGYSARFKCPACEYEADADYNAAKNLAIDGIEGIIEKQCAQQGIALSKSDEAATNTTLAERQSPSARPKAD